jgi:hypothetical protein
MDNDEIVLNPTIGLLNDENNNSESNRGSNNGTEFSNDNNTSRPNMNLVIKGENHNADTDEDSIDSRALSDSNVSKAYTNDVKHKDEIYRYYETKEKYMNDYQYKISKIQQNKDLDATQKKQKIKAIKMQCIFCKRAVATHFSNKNHTLLIKCGSNDTPCSNKFELKLARYQHIEDIIQDWELSLQEIKKQIIYIKTKLLYNYLDDSEAVSTFEKVNDDLNEYTTMYLAFLRKREDILNNHSKQHVMMEKKSKIDEIKQLNNHLMQKYQSNMELKNKQNVQNIQNKDSDTVNHSPDDSYISNSDIHMMNQELLQSYVENIKEQIQPLQQEYHDLQYAHKEVYENTLQTSVNTFQAYEHIYDSLDGHELIQNDLP